MCGICGSLSLAARDVDPHGVESMLAGLVHRGPDAEGMYREPGIAAGIRRLAVIDVSGGDQPIAGEDGAVQVVFNGEIYNFRELRDSLESRGHRFRTRSDTEVLVHLWEEHGTGMVEPLNGMFAFCMHDRSRGETFIARDRLGIKPLYYVLRGDRLVFSSELRSLLRHPEVHGEIDPAALLEMFCLQYVTGDRTLYAGIRKLLPGHAIHVRRGEARIGRWYEPAAAETAGGESRVDRPGQLRELLEDSVRMRTVADVPLGMFLSGGIDSTIILAHLSRHADGPVRTFSVGFEEDGAFDERRYARLAADRFGARHHELVLSAEDAARRLPELVEHLDAPVMDPAMIPTWLLSRFARRQVTVVLAGEGADELFAGYRRYRYQHRYGWLARVPLLAAAAGSRIRRRLPGRTGQALEAVSETDPGRNHARWASTVSPSDARDLFGPEAYRSFETRSEEVFGPYFHGAPSRLTGHLRADLHQWLPHDLLAKVDGASMAHSLEARVPFLDHRVVEWAGSLPDDLLIRGKVTKRILRQAYARELPPEILNRPKRGFDLPLASWIRGPLRDLAREMMTADRLRRWEGLRAEAAGAMLRRHLEGKADHGLALFGILSVMLFLEKRT